MGQIKWIACGAGAVLALAFALAVAFPDEIEPPENVGQQTAPEYLLGEDGDGDWTWATPTEVVAAGGGGGGGATPLSDADPAPTGAASVAGTATSASRGDHVHSVTLNALAPRPLGATGAAGNGTTPGPWNHVHPTTGLRQVPSPSGVADGRVLTVNDDVYGWAPPAGGGGGATPLSDADPAPTSAAAVAGTAPAASRGDHVHPMTFSLLAPKEPASTARPGASDLPGPWDHQHPFQPLSSFGAVGASGTCAKANSGRNGLQYGDCGSPRVLTNKLPRAAGTAAPGADTQVSRSDHVHPAQLSGSDPAPTGSAAVPGTSALASRGDHIHQVTFSAIAPKPLGSTAAAGSGTVPTPWDHVHPTTGLRQVPDPSHVADGHVLTVDDGAYAWAAGGGGGGGGGGDWITLATRSNVTIPRNNTGTSLVFASGQSATTQRAHLRARADWRLIWRNSSLQVTGYIGPIGDATPETGSYAHRMLFAAPGNYTVTGFSPQAYTSSARMVGLLFHSTGTSVLGNSFGGVSTTFTLQYRLPGGGGGGGGTTPLSDSAPLALGTAAAGTGTTASRGDHVHPKTGIRELPEIGLLDRNKFLDSKTGTPQWVDKPVGVPAFTSADRFRILAINAADNPAWSAPAGVVRSVLPYATTTPANVGATGAVGASGDLARADHVHGGAQAATATPEPTGPALAATPGTSALYARADHVHQGPVSKLLEDGTCSVSGNGCRVQSSSSGVHTEMTRADPYRMFQITFRQTVGGTNIAYGVWCHGSATPLGSAESREFYCWGPRGDGQAMWGEIGITPSAFTWQVNNLNTRGVNQLTYHVVGMR